MSEENNIVDSSKQFDDVELISISDEMKRSYLDYAMSVIVSRALPDVRDGLKPVHRRILYTMNEGGYSAGKAYKKSARIVGDVIGKYHPHGDSAVYDAMVRLAQDFSMRIPMVDGQGNYGSMDGDRAAAYRYTEARMARIAHAMIEDIDKDTVDFQPNYDDSLQEPVVLPARLPYLLINGASGIAVGMATNILPHNPNEVIDACCALVDNHDISDEELINIVPGPDFPTGGIIMGRGGSKAALLTGRGSVIVRGKAEIELNAKKQTIIITEIPYQVNKAQMVEQMYSLAQDKKIEGISEIRDESDRHGVRVVVEVKRDFEADVVLNQLYRYTQLQKSFGVNSLALDGGRPKQMNLRQMLQAFISFREEVIRRRTNYLLRKARDKAHILAGLAVAVDNVDEIIATIRNAKNREEAEFKLCDKKWAAAQVAPLIELIAEPGRLVVDGVYQLSEAQAKAIVELRLHRLTGLEREKIHEDLREITEEISGYLQLLASREMLLDLLKQELLEVKSKFGSERITEIDDSSADVDDESLIRREDVVITVSNEGYIKRVPLNTYRAQKRGGRGRSGMATKDEDFVCQVYMVSTHTPLLFFTSKGIVHAMKGYKVPAGTPQSRGRALINLLPLQAGETVTTILALPEDEASWSNLYAVFCTDSGYVRRNALSDFTNIRSNGLISMKLEENESLINVMTVQDDDDIFLSTRKGNSIRFTMDTIRQFAGRYSRGVRAIKLAADDYVVSMSSLKHNIIEDVNIRNDYLRYSGAIRRGEENVELPTTLSQETYQNYFEKEEFILSVSARGFGKITSAYEYRCTNRGGVGLTAMDLTEKTGELVSAFPVQKDDQLVMVSNEGQLIRLPLNDVRIAGRRTQGVTLFKMTGTEQVISVTRLSDIEDDDTGEELSEDGTTENSTMSDAQLPTHESIN